MEIEDSKLISDLRSRRETAWINPNLEENDIGGIINGYGFVYMQAAQNRFMRFLPYFKKAFPETAPKAGVIESQLIEIPAMKEWLNSRGAGLQGRLYLKDDAHLPIAGSVKARGGIHEVLKVTEDILHRAGMLKPTDDYSRIDSDEYREYLSHYTIQVGSTGNLGLSIGIMSAKLGYKVIVHMSRDAKQWKKELLRLKGVTVMEYDGDYSEAVAKGREMSEEDENSHFVDDENSRELFFGYSTAAMRLKVQLYKAGICVDHEHPLFVYIPCGVGGAPSGITFGLKELFGSDVHCFFAEPAEAPCFTLGMATGKYSEISVQDIGLTGRTVADGLAVGRPSGFSCMMMDTLVSGSFTVADKRFTEYKGALKDTENIFAECSACAGFLGAESIERPETGLVEYIERNGLVPYMADATHIVWSTGGGLLEKVERV